MQENNNKEEPSNTRGTTIMHRKVEEVQTTCKTKNKAQRKLKQHKPFAKMKKQVQANKKKTYAKAKAHTIKSKCKKKKKECKMGPKGRTIDLLCKIEVVLF